MLTLSPRAYVKEVQTITYDAYLSWVDDRDVAQIDKNGFIVVQIGLWQVRIPWDATEDEFALALLNNVPIINSGNFGDNNSGWGFTGLSVSKTSSKSYVELTGQNGGFSHVSNTWTVTFGVSDGNIPQMSISYTGNITRELSSLTSTSDSTITDGISCEVQEIKLVGANSGGFSVSFDGYSSNYIPFDASSRVMKAALIGKGNAGFRSVDDVHVTKVRDSEYTTRWIIYFIDTPGPLALMTINDADNTLTSTTATAPQVKLEINRRVAGQAVGLSGSFTLAGAHLTSGTSAISLGNSSTMASDILTRMNAVVSNGVVSITPGSEVVSRAHDNWYSDAQIMAVQGHLDGTSGNGKISFIVEFNSSHGDIPLLTIDSTNISGTEAVVGVSEIRKGATVSNVQVATGSIGVSVTNVYASTTSYESGTSNNATSVMSRTFAHDVNGVDLAQIFESLGLGAVSITRSDNYYNDGASGETALVGTYEWDIIFHEMPSDGFDKYAINFTADAMHSNSRIELDWYEVQASKLTNGMVSPRFSLNMSNSFTMEGSSSEGSGKLDRNTLSLESSNLEISEAVASVTNIDASYVHVSSLDRPNGGRTWIIEINTRQFYQGIAPAILGNLSISMDPMHTDFNGINQTEEALK